MTKFKLLVLLICPVLLLTQGCATIVTGTSQKVPVNSTPDRANVRTNTGYSGMTPCVLDLERKKSHVL